MKEYINTIIYKIYCKNEIINDVYVGHTTNFYLRKNGHKSSCTNKNNKHYNLPVYIFIRQNGGWDNWQIEEVEKFPCNNYIEASQRERYWVENLKATLNKVVPSRTKKEWENEHKQQIEEYIKQYRIDNKDTIKENKALNYKENKKTILEKHKNYYQKNKEKTLAQQKIYYEQNKEKINEQNKIYRDTHKEKLSEKIKEYKIQNKDIISEKNKKYYLSNKEIISEKNKIYRHSHKEQKSEKDKEYRKKNKDKLNQKINCVCGGTYSYSHKSTHFKTKLHQNFINNTEKINENIDLITINM
jgi:hypothetical protein